MDRKGHISYYTWIKSILALLKAKNKIYPINNKAEIKMEYFEVFYLSMHALGVALE